MTLPGQRREWVELNQAQRARARGCVVEVIYCRGERTFAVQAGDVWECSRCGARVRVVVTRGNVPAGKSVSAPSGATPGA